MTSLHALIQTLDDWMKPELFKDYAPNGLQVEGRDTISRLALGVTASADVIQQAVAWGADALLVHQNNDFETVLFQLSAKNFGLKVNADAFLSLSKSIDFSII